MKTIKLFLALLIIGSVSSLKAGDKLEVQYIAVHFGNASHMQVLDKEAFPEFKFYSAPGEVFGYTEEQKMIGRTTYLTGWYGEVPEKMGFCANYRGEYKGKSSFPHSRGTAFVLDKNGTVTYQLPPEKFYGDGWRTKRDGIASNMRSAIRKARKGKEEKILKEKKREYLKETTYGELEPTKGADIDKKGEGLIEWPIPDLELIDENGNKVSLNELTKGKATVLVLFTLNGITWKKANNDGEIEKEWKGVELLNERQYNKIAEEKFIKEAKEKGAFKTTAKMVAKEGFGRNRSAIHAIFSGEGKLTDKEKYLAYIYFLKHIDFVRSL